MIGQKVQSEISPERFVINVIQRNVEELSRNKEQELSTATKLKSCLMKIVNISRSNNPDLNSILVRIVQPTQQLLGEYVNDVKSIIVRIEETKQKSKVEQLKLIGKVGMVLQLVDRAVRFIESISSYPHSAVSKEDIDNIKKSFEELGSLPDKISNALKKKYRGIRRGIRGDFRLAKGKKPFKHMKLYLVPKIKDEERKAAEQRVYFIDEKGLEYHLTLLMGKFNEERDKIVATIDRIASQNTGKNTRLNDVISAHWQPLPINQLRNFPFESIKDSVAFREQLTGHFTDLSRLVYAFVYDVKNLLDLYSNHSRSTVNLNIDLSIEEADKLREMSAIIDLIEQFPKNLKVLGPITNSIKELKELIKRIEVYAIYD